MEKVPVSVPKTGHILVRTVASLVSVGTEKYMLELARKSLLGEELARLAVAKQVLANPKLGRNEERDE